MEIIEKQPRYEVARRRMIAEQIVARGVSDERVLQAMNHVPRHFFVDPALADQAYSDNPVGIGEGQTISQPYIVALMTAELKLKGDETILEIGTGCGYQTSILAELAKQVYTIERIKPLALKARRVLKDLGYKNIIMRIGDGTNGWDAEAKFDGILVAAASPQIPAPLVNQLSVGGRLVIPIGDEQNQNLIRVTRNGEKIMTEDLGPCRFVKLVGKFGWKNQRTAGDKFAKRSLV